MNNKAMSTQEMVYWIVRILFAVMMLVSIFFIARIYESKVIDTAEIEAGLFKNYLLYSPEGLSYRNPSDGRLYPGIIDVKNLNTERLESAADFGTPNDMAAALITLYNSSNDYVSSAYYNRQRYDDWKPLTYKTFLGAGAVLMAINETYVIFVDENGNKMPGTLRTIVMVPRT